jgi:hypothetical protein
MLFHQRNKKVVAAMTQNPRSHGEKINDRSPMSSPTRSEKLEVAKIDMPAGHSGGFFHCGLARYLSLFGTSSAHQHLAGRMPASPTDRLGPARIRRGRHDRTKNRCACLTWSRNLFNSDN